MKHWLNKYSEFTFYRRFQIAGTQRSQSMSRNIFAAWAWTMERVDEWTRYSKVSHVQVTRTFHHVFDFFLIWFVISKNWLGTSLFSDELDTEQGISIDILKQDQKDFIVNTVDVEEMTEASRKFRQKFDFFVRVNKFLMDLASEKTLLALDKAKQQSIKIRSEAMLCQISRFCPPKDWCNAFQCEFWKTLNVNFHFLFLEVNLMLFLSFKNNFAPFFCSLFMYF